MDGGGQALFAFVRHWSRRWNTSAGDDHGQRGRDVLVVEAVHALQDRGGVTVNKVAAELNLDQSNASRMLAHAVTAGYLQAGPGRLDRRRRDVQLTDAGRQLLADAHAWQDQTFADLTTSWTVTERTTFVEAMHRLITASATLEDGD